MSTITLMFVIAIAGLFSWAIFIGWMDAMLRRRHDEMMSAREWQETVEAMRRMVDQEGDA